MRWLQKETIIEPAAPAIIMAIGIFLIGVMDYFPFKDEQMQQYLVVGLCIVTIYIYSLLIVTFSRKRYLVPLIGQPIRSFALGTWVAAISVVCNVLLFYFPEILPLIKIIALLNVLFFGLLFLVFTHSFYQLYKNHTELKVDGIVLLSTVSVQSIVILLYKLFGRFSDLLLQSMIMIGLLFYIISLLFIVHSYKKKFRNLADDWANTNCIIHGALSITGLALVTTNTFPLLFTHIVWWCTLGVLIFIEGIEIIRAIQRAKKYALRHGIFSYHVTQWSRNFTFGMFFMFTYIMLQKVQSNSDILNVFQHIILHIWAWVVLLFLLIQIFLFLYGKSVIFTKKRSF